MRWTRGIAPLLAASLCTTASGAGEEPLSRLKDVSVKAEKDEVTVRLKGSRAPDFTSYTLKEPFRVVVDWAGSTIEGVSERLSFGHGLVKTIQTQQFESEAERISRITIELARETTFRFETASDQIIIRFAKVELPKPEEKAVPAHKDEKQKDANPVIASGPEEELPSGPLTEPAEIPPPPPPPKPVVAVAPPAPPKPVIAAAPIATAPPAAPALPVASTLAKPVVVAAPSAPQQVAPTAATQKTAQVVAPPAPPVLATKEVKAGPAGSPAPTLREAPRAEPKKEEIAAPAKLAEKAPAPTKPDAAPLSGPSQPAGKTAPEKPPLVVSRAGEGDKAPAAKPQPPLPVVKAELAKPKALAAPLPIVRVEPARQKTEVAPADDVAALLANKLRPRRGATDRAATDLASSWSRPKAPAMVVAEGEGEAETVETKGSGSEGDKEADPGPRVMKYIGFTQKASGPSVFVRLDGKGRYRIKAVNDAKVVLELLDTSINVKNNERFLDTSYFDCPVIKIQAISSGSSTRVEIDLREMVPYKVKRVGRELSVEFSKG